MRSLSLLALVQVAACPAPTRPGVECNVDADCFVGNVCAGGVCAPDDAGEGEGEGEAGEGEGDAGEGEAGEGEGEGEGCGGHDEDGDGVGDACDDCPADPDSAQSDSDGDGVGDACDPRPEVRGDVLLAFDAFTGVALGSQWTGAGAWSVSGDALHHTSTSTAEILTRNDISSTDQIEVELRFTIESFELGGQFNTANAGVGLLMTDADDGVMCFPVIGTDAQALVIDGMVDNNANDFRASTPLTSVVAQPLVLRALMSSDAAGVQCVLDGVANVSDTTQSPVVAGGVALRANRTVTTFTSFTAWGVAP